MIIDFGSLIIAESKISTGNYSDRRKLIELGNIYYSASKKLLVESDKLLEIASVPYTKDPDGDVPLDSDFTEFLDGLMRQSISSNFFKSYIYRTTDNSKINEGSHTCVCSIRIKDSADDKTFPSVSLTEIAEVEDVKQWSKLIVGIMEQNQKAYSFTELVEISQLSPARVFLALLLSDCFKLFSAVDEISFYQGTKIIKC